MKKMSFIAHLEELRRRLFWSLIFLGVGVVIAFWQRHLFLELVSYPHQWAMKKTELASSFYVFRYQDNFIAQLKISLVFGFLISFPFILFQFLKFISAGLYENEKRKIYFSFLPAFFFLFLCGTFFGYYFLIPYGLEFLITMGLGAGLEQMIGFNNYVSLFFLLVIVTGVVFELPLLMVLLSRMTLVNSMQWRKYRSHAILAGVVLAAFLTPPDPITQILLAIPLILLYELGIWFCYFVEKRSEKVLSLS